MATIYTRRLAAGRFTDGEWHFVYRVVAGTTVVVRDMVVANIGTAAVTFEVLVSPITRTGQWWLWMAGAVPAKESRHLDLRQELLVDEELAVRGTGGAYDYGITAYVFE